MLVRCDALQNASCLWPIDMGEPIWWDLNACLHTHAESHPGMQGCRCCAWPGVAAGADAGGDSCCRPATLAADHNLWCCARGAGGEVVWRRRAAADQVVRGARWQGFGTPFTTGAVVKAMDETTGTMQQPNTFACSDASMWCVSCAQAALRQANAARAGSLMSPTCSEWQAMVSFHKALYTVLV